jgi:alkylation response protein AidB-like acyl-CoA dehydrogenase
MASETAAGAAGTTREDMLRTIRDFAADKVAPTAAERDREGGFARRLWDEMGALGMHGMAVPVEHGGIGSDVALVCDAARAFGRAGRDFGLGLSWLSSMYVTSVPLLELGTEEQIARYVPRLAAGELIGSQAISEPEAGSDVAAIRTRARREGGEWVIDGGKIFITNAPVSDLFLVLAVTDPEAGRKGLTLLLVDRDTPGLEIASPMQKMGNHASPTAEVFFDGVRVPEENVLGEPGRGFYDFLRSSGPERVVLSALNLGVLEAAMDTAVAYAKERVQFGRPIAEMPAIRIKLADMQIAIEAGAGMIEKAAARLDSGKPARTETSVAKVFISEACVAQGLQAMQVLGGYGYMREYELERLFRDMKLMTVGGGTNEIHREMIAKAVLAEDR